MKKIIFVITFIITFFSLYANDWKIVEKSEKKMPEWLSENQSSNSLIVTVEAPTLKEARVMAEQELLRSIISAVATNVTYSSSESMQNLLKNDKLTTTEDFQSKTEINAAKLPFIKGVSLSEAQTYWELRENKKSHVKRYIFTARYPLPSYELDDMRRQFKAYDSEKQALYEKYKSGFDNVHSAVEINEAIEGLSSLQEYFFDNVRLKEAASLEKRYRQLYNEINLSGEFVNDNTYKLIPLLRGKPFQTGRSPEVKSECAIINNIVPQGDIFLIKFNTDDCIRGELNTLDIKMRIGTARLSHIVQIPN